MNIKNKSVLVTGGAGFIGSHLVDMLAKEEPENIVVVDNLFLGKEINLSNARNTFPKLKFYNANVSNYEIMKQILTEENIDVVFNLAVIPLIASLTKPKWTFQENIEISSCICELAREEYFDTLIHFSSSEVYGTSEYAPMDEKHPLNGTTPYAASKSASDLLALSYYRTFGIDVSIVRPFNNYGPRQNERSYAGVIPLTIKRILSGEAPIIQGSGKQTRDYLFVTDTAKSAINIYNVKGTRGKAINIASGKEISIETLIRKISELMDCKLDIIYKEERPGDVRRHIANIYLAEDLINFKPATNFEEGLLATIDWYKNHSHRTE